MHMEGFIDVDITGMMTDADELPAVWLTEARLDCPYYLIGVY